MKSNLITIDAKDKILGRLSTQIATILRGKDKTDFAYNKTPDVKVTVINAAMIKLTGNKTNTKKYYSHSGYLGNLKTITYDKMYSKNPSEILLRSVKNMLPKNRLQKTMLKNLIIHNGEANV